MRTPPAQNRLDIFANNLALVLTIAAFSWVKRAPISPPKSPTTIAGINTAMCSWMGSVS